MTSKPIDPPGRSLPGAGMTVTVRLFAILRERAGGDRVELELPDGATVADALEALSKIPTLEGLLARIPVQMAVNRDYASPETVLSRNDELALIPPLSGGDASADPYPSPGASAHPGQVVEPAANISETGARVHVSVTAEPLSLGSVSRAVSDPRAGAIVSFQGVTRVVDHLDYEAYHEMAGERIALILTEVRGATRAVRRRGRASHRSRRAGRAQRDRRGIGPAPHRSVRGRARDHRPHQGRGADLEERGGCRRGLAPRRRNAPRPAPGSDRPPQPTPCTSSPVAEARPTHLDDEGHARMVDVGGKDAR